MEYFKLVLNVLEYTLYTYLGLTTLYLLFFAISGIFSSKQSTIHSKNTRKIAILIPGYKEDFVIIETVKQAMLQKYPQNKFDIIVIADSFKSNTISELKTLPIKLIEVVFDVSTKAKALNKAMEIIDNDYDIALVLDADNIIEQDFLTKINLAFNKGFKVVQAHRVAKNINNSFAILDAVSEEINNYIFRKAHRTVGLSAALIGSGMAFDYNLFKSTMSKINAVGGFDKQLEMFLLKNGYVIEYLENAIIKDEKVQKSEVFANQRRRWLSAQFIYFWENIANSIITLITKGNIDYFDKVVQMGQLPRLILLGIISFITILYSIIFVFAPAKLNFFALNLYHWLAILGLLMLSLFLSVPQKYYNTKTLKALLILPKGFTVMFLSMIKFRGANKKFIHTQHGENTN